jgi:hypothetical protein
MNFPARFSRTYLAETSEGSQSFLESLVFIKHALSSRQSTPMAAKRFPALCKPLREERWRRQSLFSGAQAFPNAKGLIPRYPEQHFSEFFR